jgi:hypothetical protein
MPDMLYGVPVFAIIGFDLNEIWTSVACLLASRIALFSRILRSFLRIPFFLR